MAEVPSQSSTARRKFRPSWGLFTVACFIIAALSAVAVVILVFTHHISNFSWVFAVMVLALFGALAPDQIGIVLDKRKEKLGTGAPGSGDVAGTIQTIELGQRSVITAPVDESSHSVRAAVARYRVIVAFVIAVTVLAAVAIGCAVVLAFTALWFPSPLLWATVPIIVFLSLALPSLFISARLKPQIARIAEREPAALFLPTYRDRGFSITMRMLSSAAVINKSLIVAVSGDRVTVWAGVRNPRKILQIATGPQLIVRRLGRIDRFDTNQITFAYADGDKTHEFSLTARNRGWKIIFNVSDATADAQIAEIQHIIGGVPAT